MFFVPNSYQIVPYSNQHITCPLNSNSPRDTLRESPLNVCLWGRGGASAHYPITLYRMRNDFPSVPLVPRTNTFLDKWNTIGKIIPFTERKKKRPLQFTCHVGICTWSLQNLVPESIFAEFSNQRFCYQKDLIGLPFVSLSSILSPGKNIVFKLNWLVHTLMIYQILLNSGNPSLW